MFQPETRKTKQPRVTVADTEALQRRAAEWGRQGGPGRAGIHAQADSAYLMSLDFFRLGLGGDFARWLSVHSGQPLTTCWRRYKAGIARAAKVPANRNQSGLLAELRERETTPIPDLAWDDE